MLVEAALRQSGRVGAEPELEVAHVVCSDDHLGQEGLPGDEAASIGDPLGVVEVGGATQDGPTHPATVGGLRLVGGTRDDAARGWDA